MANDKDKILLRAKDIGLLLSIFTLLGFLFGPAKKIFQMEQTIADVATLKQQQIGDHTDVAVIKAQFTDIQEQLKQINWQLRKMNRRGENND